MPDRELLWISAAKRKLLGESEPLLTDLLDRSGKHWIYNKKRLEKMTQNVSTCGDHVAHRIYRLLHNKLDLKQYLHYMEFNKEKYNIDYDIIVSKFVQEFNI